MGYVELNSVEKSYGNVVAADGIDLSVREGEFFALLGPSGCGKTTILRLIAGFIQPDAGNIRVGGRQIGHIPPERRNIGMVFQNYALFPHLSVAKNIAFGLSVKRVPRDQIRRRVGELLDLVMLTDLGNRFPRELSGGQQQRVALARALITRPSVLLLDEPLAALDKQLRSQMQVELRELQRKLGITAIFVTHDQEEAMTLSDRIAVMNAGRIVQVGESSEVYERPRTRFISSFLGQSNFFTGRLLATVDGIARVKVRDGLELHGSLGDAVPPGPEVTLAVRPEKVRLSTEPSRRPNAVAARVVHRVYMGTSTTYLLQPEAGDRITAFCQNEHRKPQFAIDDPVYAAWETESCFLVEE